MKETTKRYTNFLSEEENKKHILRNQELEPLTNNSKNVKETQLYTDKNVLECQVHEEKALDVKDICVDERNNEMVTIKDYYLEPSNDRMNNIEDNHDETKSESSFKTHEVDSNLLPVNESINDHGNITVQDLQYSSEEQINSSGISSTQQDQSLPSLKTLLESIYQRPFQNPEEKSSKTSVENKPATEGDIPLNLNNAEPSASNKDHHNTENLERVNELSIEPNTEPNLQDVSSVNEPMVNPVHRGNDQAESSLTVAGPISGLVTWSGRIGFSGSASLRSDSSTTSTRSFAFPILQQNEWNTSPARMAKADRRVLPKHHRGWKHGFLCFRF